MILLCSGSLLMIAWMCRPNYSCLSITAETKGCILNNKVYFCYRFTISEIDKVGAVIFLNVLTF